ncbi:MAG TPA: hypothetical protein DD379_12435 [Cyanobacteria bacterium UBA11162]|nr:hypothetical protein [Cyanobacteria bacterium UBA11162]
MPKEYNLEKELLPKRGERLISQKEAMRVCAFDEQAMEITTKSTFTTHNRYGAHRAVRAANIINDFFYEEHFQRKTILELGPGHYSFALLARHLGAEVICVERDSVHVELGRYLGFKVLDMNFEDLTIDNVGKPVDGLWMKGAFNACRNPEIESIYSFVKKMTDLIAPMGWGWCVTVNKAANREGEERTEFETSRIEVQRDAYAQSGWDVSLIQAEDRKRYALTYAGSFYYFTRQLPIS